MAQPFPESCLERLRQRLIHPGFRIFIEDSEGRPLMIRRSDDGLRGLPAGSPELGESIEACTRREGSRFSATPAGDELQNGSLLIGSGDWGAKPRVNDPETTSVRFPEQVEFPPAELCVRQELRCSPLLREFRRTGRFQWA